MPRSPPRSPFSSVTHVEVTWVTGRALRAVCPSGHPWPAPSPGPPSRAARPPQRPPGDLRPRLTSSPNRAYFFIGFFLSVALSMVSSSGKRTFLSCLPGRRQCLKRACHMLSGNCVECCQSHWTGVRCTSCVTALSTLTPRAQGPAHLWPPVWPFAATSAPTSRPLQNWRGPSLSPEASLPPRLS